MVNSQFVVRDGSVGTAQRSAIQEIQALIGKIAAADSAALLIELATTAARALVLVNGREGDGAIVPAPRDAPGKSSDSISVSLAGGLCEMERFIVREAVRRCRGNKAAAARVLGLHRRTLYRILGKDHGPTEAARRHEGR